MAILLLLFPKKFHPNTQKGEVNLDCENPMMPFSGLVAGPNVQARASVYMLLCFRRASMVFIVLHESAMEGSTLAGGWRRRWRMWSVMRWCATLMCS